MEKTLILTLLCISITSITPEKPNSVFSKLQEGDIIFHESLSEQAKAIKLATKSRYSHVGIIFKYKDELKVLEAIQPVKITELESFVKRGVNQHFVIKRIKNSEDLLTKDKIRMMKEYGNSFIGKNYDLYFQWSNEKIYCTELVWKIYHKILNLELGELKTLEDFNLTDPIVKKIMKARYGSKIPLKEPVISPSDMFDSQILEEIIRVN
jgi:hypothetical protein